MTMPEGAGRAAAGKVNMTAVANDKTQIFFRTENIFIPFVFLMTEF